MPETGSKIPTPKAAGDAFERLCSIMRKLRASGGCPWDARQTPESLKPYILEEAYELLEAIDLKDNNKIREELGDLLLQVVFQATIFAEQNRFDAADVANTICDKLERRHPHVFAGTEYKDEKDLHRQWDDIKSREHGNRTKSAYERIPRTLPALTRTQKLFSRASRAGDRVPAPADLPPADSDLDRLTDRQKDLVIGARLAETVLLAMHHERDAETALLTWVEEVLRLLSRNSGAPNPAGEKS
ncbi:MAG: MazG family protein [Deltaproteobacteria bacterium]|nr:MAG: MazG family protein [Deltaproteobacteria bacterium]